MTVCKQSRAAARCRFVLQSALALALSAACASKKNAPEAAAPVPVSPPSKPVPILVSTSSDAGVALPAASAAPEPAETEEIPKDCNYRVKGFCFKTDEEACAAAGCDARHCLVLESHPAHVKCRS